MILFVLIENRVQEPVMPMSMFTKPAFVAVILSLACGWMSFGMFQFYVPQFLLKLRGITKLELSLQVCHSIRSKLLQLNESLVLATSNKWCPRCRDSCVSPPKSPGLGGVWLVHGLLPHRPDTACAHTSGSELLDHDLSTCHACGTRAGSQLCKCQPHCE